MISVPKFRLSVRYTENLGTFSPSTVKGSFKLK